MASTDLEVKVDVTQEATMIIEHVIKQCEDAEFDGPHTRVAVLDALKKIEKVARPSEIEEQ